MKDAAPVSGPTDTARPDSRDDEAVVIGRLVGVYGVRGWLKVLSFTRPRDNIFVYTPWLLRDGKSWRAVAVTAGRPQGKGLVVKLDGVDDRDRAAAMLGTDVAVRRALLPGLGEREFYWSDLVGLAAVTTLGVELGEVKSLIETGANDVLVIAGERERLVPFVLDEFVTEVDLDGGRIVVDWDPDF